MIMIIILSVLFYLLCVVCAWLNVHESHSRGGQWSSLKPDGIDIFTIFFLTNIPLTVEWIFKKIRKERRCDSSKFFKINK